MKKAVALVLALVLALGAISAMAETTKVKIGVVGANKYQWEDVIIPNLEKEGIEIELVTFSNYQLPNQALADGEIDLNAFQHYNFMNNWSKENGAELVAIGETFVAPLCLYSNKITSIDEFKDGDTIAIMSDAVNETRALRILETIGLIKISEDAGALLTAADVDLEASKVKLNFFEIEAAFTPSSLNDDTITAAFVNADHATDAGLSSKNALYKEQFDPENETMQGIINIIAARAEDAENPVYLRIVEEYHTDAVKELLETIYLDNYIPMW